MVVQRSTAAVAADSRVSARLRCRSPIPSASRAGGTSSAVKPSARISSVDDSSRRATRAAALTAGGATSSQPIAAGSLAREADARWSTSGGRVTSPSRSARAGDQGKARVGDVQLLGAELLDRRPPQGGDARQVGSGDTLMMGELGHAQTLTRRSPTDGSFSR
jgi:hypothetical protein